MKVSMIFIILLEWILAAPPVHSKTLFIDNSLKEMPIGKFIEYIVDKDGKLTFNEIRSPGYDDEKLDQVLITAKSYLNMNAGRLVDLAVELGYEGMEFDL